MSEEIVAKYKNLLDKLLNKRVVLENHDFIIDSYEALYGGFMLKVSDLQGFGSSFNDNEHIICMIPWDYNGNIITVAWSEIEKIKEKGSHLSVLSLE